MVDHNTIASIIEFILLLGAIVILILVYKKYRARRVDITKLLFICFVFITLSLLFLLMSRQTYYRFDVELMDPNSVEGWIMFRIGYYRPSFICVIIAGYYLYLFKCVVFQRESNTRTKRMYLLLATLISLYQVILFEVGNDMLDVVAFLLVLVYFNLSLIPFMIASIKLYVRLEDGKYKSGILSLIFMAICFILIFFFFLIDRIIVLLAASNFSVFAYLGDISIFLGIVAGYFGFIRPGAKQGSEQIRESQMD